MYHRSVPLLPPVTFGGQLVPCFANVAPHADLSCKGSPPSYCIAQHILSPFLGGIGLLCFCVAFVAGFHLDESWFAVFGCVSVSPSIYRLQSLSHITPSLLSTLAPPPPSLLVPSLWNYKLDPASYFNLFHSEMCGLGPHYVAEIFVDLFYATECD